MLSGAREAGCFREVAVLHSDHLRQVPLYTTSQITDCFPFILGETLPDPLGLWNFTWEVPKGVSFANFHHCLEELHFSISGYKLVKMAYSPDD